ncbi:MAG: hypothetical protein ACOCWA_02180 [Bacteroidota bacterium]
MFKLFLSLLLTAFLISTSCMQKSNEVNEQPVARVYDKYLYPTDLANQIPEGVNQDDSLRIARRLVQEWVQDMLLLKQAEVHLPEDLREIEKQVEEYRSALLIFKYKQNLLSQNLDSLVSDKKISGYYNENASNYVLESDIVQVTYIKVPVSAPQISDVRRWYRSDREDYKQSLIEYCKEYAENYAIDDTSWVHFTNLIDSTPLNIDNPSRYLNYNKNIESRDSDYYHFIRINNRKKEGEVKPLSMVEEDIRTVLINKRKLEYLQNLESTVYREGLSRNQVEIY